MQIVRYDIYIIWRKIKLLLASANSILEYSQIGAQKASI